MGQCCNPAHSVSKEENQLDVRKLEPAEEQTREKKAQLAKLYGRSSILTINPSQFVFGSSGTIHNDYIVDNSLGEGAYGIVYRALHKKTAEIRAIKWIDKNKAKAGCEKKLLQEINILRHLDHPNIMRIYEFAADPNGYSIISEFISGGELFDELAKRKSFSEKDAAHIMKQLLGAMSYCHARNVIHRDLKPENIIIDSKENSQITVKIIDFGTALVYIDHDNVDKVGTIYYIAPEVLTGNISSKCDIWSLGIILYIMLCGYPPFNGETDQDIINSITKGVLVFPEHEWSKVSGQAKDLIIKMLTYEPEERITAADALNHSWIKMNEIQNPVNNEAQLAALQNIKGFTSKSRLQKAAMMFMVTQLMSKPERDELSKVFLSIDKNGDGKLTREELIVGYVKQYGDESIATKEVDDLLSAIDLDKDGEINYSEFLLAAANKKKLLTLNNVKDAFDAFDVNKSGFIRAEELKKILGPGKNLDEKIWKEIISEVDTNGDGQISYQEFETMMNKYFQ